MTLILSVLGCVFAFEMQAFSWVPCCPVLGSHPSASISLLPVISPSNTCFLYMMVNSSYERQLLLTGRVPDGEVEFLAGDLVMRRVAVETSRRVILRKFRKPCESGPLAFLIASAFLSGTFRGINKHSSQKRFRPHGPLFSLLNLNYSSQEPGAILYASCNYVHSSWKCAKRYIFITSRRQHGRQRALQQGLPCPEELRPIRITAGECLRPATQIQTR